MRSFLNFLAAVPAILAAPVMIERQDSDKIANSWIVRLNNDAVLAQALGPITAALGVQPTHTYEFGNFKGLSVDGVADALSLLTNVASIASIEPNTIVTTSALTSQANPPYGLARISHRQKGATSYIYDSSAGSGTYAYIIDTGIRTTHEDFGGRATLGKTFYPEQTSDGNGHGTHVAGTVGSTTYGVAKKTNLIAVKVLSDEGSGTNADVLAGIDFAVNDAKSKGRIGKAVANLSLGGILSPTTNAAAKEAVAQGLFLAVAAGNSGAPTITSSPASEPDVCTVGASDANDMRASFSNFGLLVDIFAPGVGVLSTWKDSDTSTNTISGTSMASPHVCGLAAYYLALPGSGAPGEPKALCKFLQEKSTKNALDKPTLGLTVLSRNYLAYNGNGA
ncbi:subtilisin-like serine protease PR1A like protein [Zymoseptoria brevis]|uniref:Subtilisin-like serine protease PR1A like protein n=1 Tax=Zymoseptoria brevis TaxID=1047168 RepID=A0A0F4GK02_9PEZI|nr:subtilisin-like serine protease PR1A like protein [Zymoseptoria brevis]